MVILGGRRLLLTSRVHKARRQLPNELSCARGLVSSIAAATTTMAAAEELVCKTAEIAQWTGAVATAAATTMTRVLSAEQSVHSHASKTPFTRGTIYTSGAVRHNWFHGTICMAHSLRSIRMRDEFRTFGSAVRMFALGSWSISRFGWFSRNLPLRNTGRQLYIIIFLACAIPLSNPARGQRGRSKRGAFGLRRGRARHVRDTV